MIFKLTTDSHVTQRDEDRESGLSNVVRSGDRLRSLQVIRDRLGVLLELADVKTAPALAQRLAAIMAEIDTMPGAGREAPLDRLAGALADDLAAARARRAEARQSGTAGP